MPPPAFQFIVVVLETDAILICWHYGPGDENIEYCDCSNSNGVDGEYG